jgi:hypothetical protein
MQRIDRSLLMRHEHLAGVLGELSAHPCHLNTIRSNLGKRGLRHGIPAVSKLLSVRVSIWSSRRSIRIG